MHGRQDDTEKKVHCGEGEKCLWQKWLSCGHDEGYCRYV